MLNKGKYESAKQNGKITEKVLLSRITVSVLLMLTLMIGMGVTAFAYFSATVVSTSSVIKAAQYDLDISIKPIQAVTVAEGEAPSEPATQAFTLEGTAIELDAGTYEITISKKESASSAKTGFCKITAGGMEYHTYQVETNSPLTFTLVLDLKQTVTFVPNWGTSALFASHDAGVDNPQYIVRGETVTVTSVTGASDDEDLEETTDPTDPTDPTEPDDQPTEYIVQEGDSLYAIAQKYGIQWKDLQAYNGIEGKTIYVGQKLLIPPADYRAPTEPTETTTPSQSTEPMETTTPSQSTEPTETTTPSQSTETTETTSSSQSTEPTETTTPSQSTEPTETTTPSQSTEPTETTSSSQSTEPTGTEQAQ